MASLRSHRLGDLIDDALSILYRVDERPRTLSFGPTDVGPFDSVFTFGPGSDELVQPTVLLENAGELVYVNAVRTADQYAVQRGYANTTPTTWEAGASVVVNPKYLRRDVADALRRCLDRLMNAHLPLVRTELLSISAESRVLEIPELATRLVDVRGAGDSLTGRVYPVRGWRYEEDLPPEISSTGKAVFPSGAAPVGSRFIVSYAMPYEFDGNTEDATVDMEVGSADIPPLWAAAYLTRRREYSRVDLDTIGEWTEDDQFRAGVSQRLVRDLWGEVYRAVDEARMVAGRTAMVRRPSLANRGW